MLMRSANGWLYASRSLAKPNENRYCQDWTPPYATNLPNPNSRPSMAAIVKANPASGPPTTSLLLASNPQNTNISRWPDWGDRTILSLSKSADFGTSWQTLAVLEDGEDGLAHCYPSVITVPRAGPGAADVAVVAYSVYDPAPNRPRLGIKVAVLTL
jgi:hypothetical protein